MKDEALFKYLLQLGDNALILGHRLSELCGHGPELETDIALTNISLDLFGQVRNYFQYAAKVKGSGTEDDIAMLRKEREYLHVNLMEQPNEHFGHVIIRQFLFDAYHLPLLEQLSTSQDEQIKAIALKSIKEVRYHLHFSSEWVRRLGAGTEISNQKAQEALDKLWPYSMAFFKKSDVDKIMFEKGIAADLDEIKTVYLETVNSVINEAELKIPENEDFHLQGKDGIHTEKLGFILTELQYMQRAYPDMQW